MFAPIDDPWVLIGTLLIAATALTLALYMLYHNWQERIAKRREHRLKKEMREAERRLQDAKRLVMIGALTGGIAYFLNNSLIIMNDLLTLLRGEPRQREQVESLTQVLSAEVQRALQASQQLCQFVQPPEEHDRPLAVSELLESAKGHIATLVPDMIDLVWKDDLTGNVVIKSGSHLERALFHLIQNAVEAMPAGGIVTVRVADLTIGDTARKELETPLDRGVFLEVADTGIGMSDDLARQAFEPFFTTKGHEKLGLGLSFVYGIVKLLDGHIELKSEENRGTTVRVMLPIASEEELIEYALKRHGDGSRSDAAASLVDRTVILKHMVGET